jgi:hypothetical protein
MSRPLRALSGPYGGPFALTTTVGRLGNLRDKFQRWQRSDAGDPTVCLRMQAMVLLAFAACGSSLDWQKSRAIRASSRRGRLMTIVCAMRPRDVGTGPELRSSGASAQRRTVSVTGIRLDSPKSARPFKAIICHDISEFGSCMPSHAFGFCRCAPCLPTSITGRRKIVVTVLAERRAETYDCVETC